MINAQENKMTDINKVIQNALTDDFAAELSKELKVDISFDLSDVVATLENQAFLAAHEEMHRQYGRLQQPAQVAPDIVINDNLMNSRIMVDTSGSMNDVVVVGDTHGNSMGGTDINAIMREMLKAPPYSGPRHMMIVTDADCIVKQKFPRPKYEKFTSNAAMVEEKLLTGSNRRSNKAIAEVRREARKLNKLRTAAQSRKERNERRNKNEMQLLVDFTHNVSQKQMAEFLKEVNSLKNSV
jgi:hypothetical protein